MDEARIMAARAVRVAAIQAIEPAAYTPRSFSKKEAEKLFETFPPVKKSFTTDFFEPNDPVKMPRDPSGTANRARNVELNITFPKHTIGKIRSVFDTTKDNITAEIRTIFDGAPYAYSTNYIITGVRSDGSIHKAKPNIEAYHHFVNKIVVDGTPYYVRFTVEELRHHGQLHTAQVSEVVILKEKSRKSDRSLLGPHPGGTAQPAYDINLIDFFNAVNGPQKGDL